MNVTIPEFGETYELNAEQLDSLNNSNVKMTNKLERKAVRTLRNEIEERLEKLKEEIKDMDIYVRQDINDKNLKDADIFRINEKIKELEKQIVSVIEG